MIRISYGFVPYIVGPRIVCCRDRCGIRLCGFGCGAEGVLHFATGRFTCYSNQRLFRAVIGSIIRGDGGRIKPGDVLITCKLDRLARSVVQGIELIEDLLSRGVTVEVLNMGRMDDTPTGRLIRQVMLAFAQFERDLIVTRTQEGKAIAKQKPDFREGRPPIYDKSQKEHALELLTTHSYSQVEKLTGMSKSTLIRYKRAKRKTG